MMDIELRVYCAFDSLTAVTLKIIPSGNCKVPNC